MSWCPPNNFQLSIMSKCLPKHVSIKVSFKINIRKNMCTFTYDYVQYETSISIWDNWNDDRTKMIDLLSFHFATRINSQNKYKYNILNEPWHINLYMNIGISNWHNWRFDTTKMTFFTLFQFLTRLLTSTHFNHIST